MLTPAPGPHRARLAAAALMCLVACKRQSPPGPGPIESGPTPPPPHYELKVTELPTVDLGPPPLRPHPWGAQPMSAIHYEAHQVQPTEDGGFVVLEPWLGHDGGRVDVRAFGADGVQRWKNTIVGDSVRSGVAGISLAVGTDTVWVAIIASGTVVLGDTPVSVTPAPEKHQLVIVRLDRRNGRVKGHTRLAADAPKPGLMAAVEDDVVMFVGAAGNLPAQEQLAPGFSGSLIRLGDDGEIDWRIGIDASSTGADLDIDGTRVLFVSDAQTGTRASYCHDGTLEEIVPFRRTGSSNVELCRSGVCSLLEIDDPTHPLTLEYNGKYRDAGLWQLAPPPPRIATALVVDDASGHREHPLGTTDCRDLIGIGDTVLVLCEQRVQLRTLDASVLAEAPGAVYGDALDTGGSIFVASRDRLDKQRVRRFKVAIAVSAGPARPGEAPKASAPATAPTVGCRPPR